MAIAAASKANGTIVINMATLQTDDIKGGEVGMTEREQVIAELLYLKHDCLEGSATDQTLDKVLALLKAQEAKVKTKCNTGLTQWYVCTSCDASVNPGDRFCRMCGKVLVWDDAG